MTLYSLNVRCVIPLTGSMSEALPHSTRSSTRSYIAHHCLRVAQSYEETRTGSVSVPEHWLKGGNRAHYLVHVSGASVSSRLGFILAAVGEASTSRSQYFPPSLRPMHPAVSALSTQSHASSLDLLAAVSTAERLAIRTPQPPRRILVSSSAQTDDALSNGLNGAQPLDAIMEDAPPAHLQNGDQ